MNETTKIVTIRLTSKLHKALKLKVLEKGTTIQQYLTELIKKNVNTITENDKETAKTTLYDENNELCDFIIDKAKINDESLTEDEKTVLEALLKISKMQNI